MDDSNKPNTNKKAPRKPLGMSSFGNKEPVQFGHNLQLAMACIEAPPEPAQGKAIPDNQASIRQRLKSLSQDMNSQQIEYREPIPDLEMNSRQKCNNLSAGSMALFTGGFVA